MEDSDERHQENVRYSFLLGCALRNDDTEQFIQVYDRIVPKDLPLEEVERIKEEARRIADLPDSQFNEIVFRAKDLSVAPSFNMKEQENALQSLSRAVEPKVNTITLKSVSRTSRHLSASVSSGTADDSGVFEESRTKVEWDKHGDSGDEAESGRAGHFDYFPRPSDEEEGGGRVGHFDYFPPQMKRSTQMMRVERERGEDHAWMKRNRGVKKDNAAYDEAYRADSDSSGTPRSNDVCSPRSDFDVTDGIEMQTLRRRSSDFVDDEDDLKDVNVHERLYAGYTRLSLEEENDEYEDNDIIRNSKSNLHIKFRSQTFRPPASAHVVSYDERNIDEAVRSHNAGQPLSPSKQRSYGTNVEVKKYESDNAPPFGDPLDWKTMKSRCGKLLGDKLCKGDTPNMPEAAEIHGNTKKKKKKKPSNKDESSESSQSSRDHGSYNLVTPDVNGNPTFNHGVNPSKFPKEFQDLTGYTSEVMKRDPLSSAVREQEERLLKMKSRRDSRKKGEHTISSNEIPNYRGKQDLNWILSYIDGPTKKKKNISQKDGGSKKRKEKKNNDHQSLKKDDRMSSETGSETYDDNGSNDLSDSSARDVPVNNQSMIGSNESPEKISNVDDKDKQASTLNNKNKQKMVDKVWENDNYRFDEIHLEVTDNITLPNSGSFVEDPYMHLYVSECKSPVEEDEFQEVVGKKKKKTVHKESPAQSLTHSFREVNMNHIVDRSPRYVRPSPRSVTPPPVLPSVEPAGPDECDLSSTSAFPALSAREGRRNSAGDVPRNRLPIVQDDSDLESVKSLPVDSRTTVHLEQIKSQISYAQIAASQKTNTHVTGQPFAKTAKVTNERRHSFDSLDKQDSTVEEGELKTRSQELPVCNPGNTISNNVTGISKETNFVDESNIDVVKEFVASEVQCEHNSSKELLGSCKCPTTGTIESSSSFPPVRADNVKMPSYTSSSSTSSSSCSVSTVEGSLQVTTSQTQSTKSRSKSSKSSKRPQKYLVFLDGSYEQLPSEFEISFGFDASLDCAMANVTPKNGLVKPVGLGNTHGRGVCSEDVSEASKVDFQFKQTTELKSTSLELDCGNFNLVDVVGHLTREWNRVQEMLKKSPQKVQVYQENSS